MKNFLAIALLLASGAVFSNSAMAANLCGYHVDDLAFTQAAIAADADDDNYRHAVGMVGDIAPNTEKVIACTLENQNKRNTLVVLRIETVSNQVIMLKLGFY